MGLGGLGFRASDEGLWIVDGLGFEGFNPGPCKNKRSCVHTIILPYLYDEYQFYMCAICPLTSPLYTYTGIYRFHRSWLEQGSFFECPNMPVVLANPANPLLKNIAKGTFGLVLTTSPH